MGQISKSFYGYLHNKLVEDQLIKGIVEQLKLEGIQGEISAINGIEVKDRSLVAKNDFLIRDSQTF